MDGQTFRQRQLSEDLRALRHLSPHAAPLPLLTDATERQLLAELLALPDAIEALRWLRAERGEVVARLALQHEVRQLVTVISGVWHAVQAGQDANVVQDRALIDLLSRLGQRATLERLVAAAGLPLALSEQVVGHAQQLRAKLPTIASAGQQSDERGHLMHELLQLAVDQDPVRWLVTERGEMVATISLERIFAQLRPSSTGAQPRSGRLRRPRGLLTAPRGVRLTIEEIAFGETGFSLTLRARFARHLASPRPEGDRRMLTWLGFERVSDDQGYAYLPQIDELSSTLLLWGSEERLRMSFFPAVAPAAQTLTFLAAPVMLEVQAIRPSERHRDLPPLALGDLSWRVAVPARP